LDDLFSGRWSSSRPGILLSFDDGLRSHAEVVAPLLERNGMTGWFMVPGGFLSAPVEEQSRYATRHSIQHASFDYGDLRIAITWDDARRLAQRHVVGCHTWNHRRLPDTVAESEVHYEVTGARARMEAQLGTAVFVFAWVGGEEDSYGRRAAAAVSKAGYRLSFMTNTYPIRPGGDPFWLQRTNIEASYPLDLVRFQLSGIMDIRYGPKRHRIAERLSHA
jgi:peptidoglycan/xylan/chitin deacetylase (PgdA/CDA1 family)